MNRKKIIYFSLLVMIILLILTSYFSYAFFTNKREEHGKLNIVAGTLDYKLENNIITVENNTIDRIRLTLTSLKYWYWWRFFFHFWL